MKSEENRKHLFGTDGVRGLANCYPMTVEMALAIGRAAAIVFRKTPGRQKVVIGKDTRLSCYMFENALIAGLCSMGVDTLMVGPLPTPGVAFITRAYRANAGVVISASHNPYHDNGIKFFSQDGFKLSTEMESRIEDLVEANDFSKFIPSSDKVGKNTKIIDADGRYVEFTKNTFPRRLSLKNLRIVLDCANGAGHRTAPLVFQELDAEVFIYNNHPNGLNINEKCGSLHPEVIQKAVIDRAADVGIALDGDADRLIMVDENAQIVDGDVLLAICALDFKRRGVLQNNTVVGTIMSNFGFHECMQEAGIQVVSAPVGDRFVIQEMLHHGCNLGGEQSGHLICLDYNTTGDGLVSALQVLRIMIETDSKLSDLAAVVKRYPQALLNIPVREKPPLEELKQLDALIRDVQARLASQGRVVVRYSGTESICRVMVEAKKQKLAFELAHEIGALIEQMIGSTE